MQLVIVFFVETGYGRRPLEVRLAVGCTAWSGEMRENLSSPARHRQSEDGRVYIDGYQTQRMESGEMPDYGYPRNHVPEAVVKELDLTTGYMATYGAR